MKKVILTILQELLIILELIYITKTLITIRNKINMPLI